MTKITNNKRIKLNLITIKNILLIVFIITNNYIFSQTRVAYTYDSSLLKKEIIPLLSKKLKTYRITYKESIDINNKCGYLIASLELKDSQIFLKIADCMGNYKGPKLICNISDTNKTEVYTKAIAFKTNNLINNFDAIKDINPINDSISKESYHSYKYLFGNSAFNLKKYQSCISTYNLFIFETYTSLSKNLSIGMGTSFKFSPIYLTSKLSFTLNKKNRIALGYIFYMNIEAVSDFNLAYAVYTYGNPKNNFTIGTGYLTSINLNATKPTISISQLASLTNKFSLFSEFHFIQGTSEGRYIDVTNFKYYKYDNDIKIGLGTLGLRYINPKKPKSSFQFGIAYYYNQTNKTFRDEIPDNQSYGNTYKDYVIPYLSLSYIIKPYRLAYDRYNFFKNN